ncbi:protein kintoun [Tachysurus vachellii]|uniref:protein kintoun n=1 Tax=Tachysurus vachellii TaxID=175792 RepID=UPI00296B46F6|nr:protein kintoun [Tachysurus vachellii]
MEFGNKLEELNMTTDEINSFSKAMKDEKFRELLHEYAQEISNPENKKKYEEEITQLEQERGIKVEFIHPNPHHVLKSSMNGKEKCFINICSNNLINEPTCKAGRAENGQLGQYWSLPYSLTPGRPDRDSKGKKYMIYDVVFHPQTLYMAGKNQRFMKLVNSTAIQGVENAFQVTLDKTNTLLKKIQYKGVPQPAVIRNQISGLSKKEESSPHDKAFNILYPDTLPVKNPKPYLSSFADSPLVPIQPHYTIKYRSFVDLQDCRCSRDSAPGTRPKEIVITIDLPLLKSAANVDLNVTDRKLALESQKPDYKLELQLSYPVDADKGDAKFNKAKKQLTVTLTVQPAKDHDMAHVEENQPESDNCVVMGTADKADEVVHEAELVKKDASCEGHPQENSPVQEEEGNEHFSIVEVSEVESQMKQTASHLEETLHNVQNSPANPSTCVLGTSEVESIIISDGPNQMNSPLDTIESLCRLKETGALSEDPNSSSKLSSSLVPLNEQVDNADSYKQGKTDISFQTPTILREKNPEGGSEIIITDHTTSAGLSFQNCLCFELD